MSDYQSSRHKKQHLVSAVIEDQKHGNQHEQHKNEEPMLLNRYCIDCGTLSPPEGKKCCPDSRVYWVENAAAEQLNATVRAGTKHFETLVSQLGQAQAARDSAETERNRYLTVLERIESDHELNRADCAVLAAETLHPELIH